MVKVALTVYLTLSLAAVSACQSKPTGVTNVGSNSPASSTPANTGSAVGEQRVIIDSPDGLKLVGSFYAASNPNSPAVLLLHQWQSDRHSYDEFAKRMQGKGFAVLSIDGRGFGESIKTADGKAVGADRTDAAVIAMLGDVGSAFDYLAKQPNVDATRIGVIGASYGSSLAIIYAADHPNVKAVALLSPGTNYFGNMPTEPAVKKYGDRPLLLVAANDDKESAAAVATLKNNINTKSEDKVYEKGGHGTALFKAGVGLEDMLESFLIKGLSK